MAVLTKPQLKSAKEMPGSFGSMFKDESQELFADEELFYWRRFDRYGKIFKTAIAGKKYAFLVGPEANKLVLAEKTDCLSARIGWTFLEPLFGKGILLLDGQPHRQTRKLMYPSMHGRALGNYFQTMHREVKNCLEGWNKDETIPLLDTFSQLTTNIASCLFLGTENSEEVMQTSQWFRTMMRGLRGKIKLDIPQTLHGRSQQARRDLQSFLGQKINERKLQGDLQASTDVLGLLLLAKDEEGNTLTEPEIIDRALMLLWAGQDNPAMLLCWILFELSAHPEWRDRLRAELAEVVGDEPLSLSHLPKLVQMGWVLKEAERLYPPVFGMSRGVIKDIEFAGYRIPAGWKVDISPMLTHRLPEIYPEPDRFDPLRFAPPREEDKKHPFSLIGFGSGPHSCIGAEFARMEMKIFLAELLRKYDWKVTPEPKAIAPIRQPSKVQETLQACVMSK
jgi:cytochrome P450